MWIFNRRRSAWLTLQPCGFKLSSGHPTLGTLGFGCLAGNSVVVWAPKGVGALDWVPIGHRSRLATCIRTEANFSDPNRRAMFAW